jgi:hypothetical protein
MDERPLEKITEPKVEQPEIAQEQRRAEGA